MKKREKRHHHRRMVLGKLRLSLCAFAALIVLAVLGIFLIRSTLLHNAHETGTALSRSYAAEESNTLAMYETLLSFGTASLDSRLSCMRYSDKSQLSCTLSQEYRSSNSS